MSKVKSCNIHAGHNPDGKTGCGAIGTLNVNGKKISFKESTEARNVVKNAIKYLQQEKVTVYDCTVNNGTSQRDIINKIVNLCNKHKVDIDVSVHFNAGAKDANGNQRSTGTEVLVYNTDNQHVMNIANRLIKEIVALGYKSRGVKKRTDLGVLKSTKSPAILIECCFVDDKDDYSLYNAETMGKAIAQGILGYKIGSVGSIVQNTKYGVKVYDFNDKKSAEDFSNKIYKNDNAYNVVKPNGSKWCVLVSSFNTHKEAEDFKIKMKAKYNAHSDVYTL